MDALSVESEHARDRGSTEVDIEHANGLVASNEREGQLGGNGGFADASLAGHDEDDVLDAVELRGLLHYEGGLKE